MHFPVEIKSSECTLALGAAAALPAEEEAARRAPILPTSRLPARGVQNFVLMDDVDDSGDSDQVVDLRACLCVFVLSHSPQKLTASVFRLLCSVLLTCLSRRIIVLSVSKNHSL